MKTGARAWYATNARNLLDTRKQGMAPAGPVAVSLIGEVTGAQTTLYVRDDMPADRLDWRMLVNLHVWLWADESVPLGRLMQHVDRIARARPHALFLRFKHPYRYSFDHAGQTHERSVDVHDIEIGNGRHHAKVLDIPETHEFLWCPTNNAATPLGAKLRKALLAKHQPFTVL